MNNPTLIALPFAFNGKRNKIENERQSGQDLEDATWSIGFPPITMTAVEEGGLPPKGLDFNGLFYELSDNTVFLAKGGRYQYDADYAKAIGGYPQGAILLSVDRTCEYISLIDGNLSDPNDEANSESWKLYAGEGSVVEASTDVAGVVKLNDTLTSDSNQEALTAKQGKVLKGLVDEKLGKNETAASAAKLSSARTFNYSGAATGSVSFDGSKDVTCVLTLANSGVEAGTYSSTIEIPSITVNAKGLITAFSSNPIRLASSTQTGVVQLVDAFSGGADKALTAERGKELNDKKAPKESPTFAYKATIMKGNTDVGLEIRGESLFNSSLKIGDFGASGSARSGFKVRHPLTNGEVTFLFPLKDPDTVAILATLADLPSNIDPILYAPVPYSKATPPTGYLVMQGQSISAELYPNLSKLYGSVLPDMRGEFIRGYDNGRGVDAGRSILSGQQDAIRNITGTIEASLLSSAKGSGAFGDISPSGGHGGGSNESDTRKSTTFDASRVVPTASENRPRNIAFNYIVKAG
ncbi:phage tail protein [Acinetobacter sp. V91_7]|uniref:phage tail protein n=1 Tax=unclassified Acinetobacter TaxID=196816 RepID=UPI00287D1FFC|nr:MULTISPECIES: phage tail protein [unclassified Acinetobacter]MDS7935680.1 phage tail protein [Acinetobacter sp. V91_4B]MDS7964712.1 phage tail protein [Acinetobacter sp. V91_7]MDS8025593.1 phage tail protein [Acinetobacter sp. V91_13]